MPGARVQDAHDWAGQGAREAWARSIAFGGRRRRSPPRAPRAPSTAGSRGRWRGCSSRLSTWPLPTTCLLLFPAARCRTSIGLAPSCRILTGLTGRFHSRHTSSLSPVSLPGSSRVGSRPLTPCNVLAATERHSALNLCKVHHIRPRPRCIPRFHLPLKRYPWRLVVPEGHLDHRWGTLGPASHLRVEPPKRFGSGSWASVGGTAQARWRIARTGGWAAGAGLRREAGPRAASGGGIQRQKRAKPLFILDFSPIATYYYYTWK